MGKRKVIFLSHSRKDAYVLGEFRKHLDNELRGSSDLEVFVDQNIRPSQKWSDTIQDALARTVVGVVLVSADLFNSEYVREHELKVLVEAKEHGHAELAVLFVRRVTSAADRVVVRVRDGGSRTIALSSFQALSRRNGPESPLNELRRRSARERVLVDAAENVVRLARGEESLPEPTMQLPLHRDRSDIRKRRPGAVVLALTAGAVALGIGWWARNDDHGPRLRAPLLDMVAIPPGAMPGEPAGPAIPAFKIGRCEITRGEWRAVGLEVPAPGKWKETDDSFLPANYTSWFDAIRFCNALSAREKLTPRYYEDEHFAKPWNGTSDTPVYFRGFVDGYRLPTEREWQYACRGTSLHQHAWGSDEGRAHEYAHFGVSSGIERVHSRRPNYWGLYGMAGNVMEWGEDWYDQDGLQRVQLGGAYYSGLKDLAFDRREKNVPGYSNEFTGFRVVRSIAGEN